MRYLGTHYCRYTKPRRTTRSFSLSNTFTHKATLSHRRKRSCSNYQCSPKVESLLAWAKILLITDQRAVVYMFYPQRTGKMKNMKLQIWRTELENINYEIIHKPRKDNVVPDTFLRVFSIAYNGLNLSKMHQQFGHPGVTRLVHFVRTKNLPFSVDDVKRVCSTCKICAELKPKFFQKPPETLMKAMRPWERISIDFKGPVRRKESVFAFCNR